MTSDVDTKIEKSVAEKPLIHLSMCQTKIYAPAATAPSKFLSMPPEIRLLIYDTYFSSPSYGKEFQKTNHFDGYTVGDIDASLIGALMDRFKPTQDGEIPERVRSNLNLLSVCRLVHSEAIPRFYHHHLFQLPTYLDFNPSRAATRIEPIVIPSAVTKHFDLIHKLEVVHHHLGDPITDRHNTDHAIVTLLETISNSCPLLRCLSMRVICDVYRERRFFHYRLIEGDFAYLDFERKTPGMLAAIMPRLRELDIILDDSRTHPDPGHPELPPKAFSGTWSWTWHDDESEYEEAEEEKGSFTETWGHRFFTQRLGDEGKVPPMDEIRRNSLYHIASMEPFAHWYDPAMS